MHSDYVTLHVPVGSPTCIVVGSTSAIETRRQTRVPPKDSGQLPSAKYTVNEPIGVPQQHTSFSYGQTPNTVDIDDVTNVKVGVRVALALEDRVQDKRSSKRSACCQTGGVIQ